MSIVHVNEHDVEWSEATAETSAGIVGKGSSVPDSVREGVRRKFLGDRERGPLVSLVEMPPGHHVKPHRHSTSEAIYIVRGSAAVDGTVGTAGSVISVQADTAYDVQVGDEGVAFLLFRDKPARYEDLSGAT